MLVPDYLTAQQLVDELQRQIKEGKISPDHTVPVTLGGVELLHGRSGMFDIRADIQFR
jgi:hypothetical protein